MNIIRKTTGLIVTFILAMASQTVLADNVTFTAQAPSAVVRGERFRISYKVTDASPKQFRAPDMKGLSVLAGPSTSTSQSTTVVNGKVTSSSSYTYTFIVVGDEEGDYKLDGATITVGKDTYTSNGLTIKVLPPDSNQPQQGQQSQQNQSSQRGGSSQQTQQNRQSSSGDNIGVDDLFMLATVDKTTVYEQEALLLTFKVYCSTSLELSSLSNKMPDLKNFHVQEVELPRRKEFQLENVTARMNKPYSKVFEEERELTMMLLVDISNSLNFGTSVRMKRDMLTEIAATLAFAAIENNDKVGLLFFSDRIEKFIPPQKGRKHILYLIRELLDFTPESNGTDISVPLEFLTGAVKKRCTAFLLSDFIDSHDYRNALTIANRKHDIVAIQVYDKRMEELPNVGLMKLNSYRSGDAGWMYRLSGRRWVQIRLRWPMTL